MNDLNKSVGGANRYTFWCDYYEQRRYYGACLSLKDAFDNKRIRPEESGQSCANAMNKGNCEACNLRAKEVDAGRSLFFVDELTREATLSSKDIDKGSDSYQRGWAQVGASLGKGDKLPKSAYKRVETQPRPIQKKDEGMFSTSVDMASVISNEIKKEKLKSEISLKLTAMKKEIALLAKTDLKAAKELLVKAKKLEQLMAA